jgi:hypothetical protein
LKALLGMHLQNKYDVIRTWLMENEPAASGTTG